MAGQFGYNVLVMCVTVALATAFVGLQIQCSAVDESVLTLSPCGPSEKCVLRLLARLNCPSVLEFAKGVLLGP
jgi:hypothetical protein